MSVQNDSTVITSKVDIWNYKDKHLQCEQQETLLSELATHTYTAFARIQTGMVVQLDSDKTVVTRPLDNKQGGKYVLISDIANDNELYWNKEIIKYQLVSLRDKNRKTILSVSYPHTAIACQLSPTEQYVTWYDRFEKNYFSYELSTGIVHNITQTIKVPLYIDYDHHITAYGLPFRIAGWLTGDKALLIYDRYDIWRVDPTNKKPPVNITAGYGRKHKIIFRIVSDNLNAITKDTLLLAALNWNTKYNGFWKEALKSSAAPIRCDNMLPLLYFFPGIGSDIKISPPIKAKNANVYLVQRMSASDAPNLFSTTDFYSFIPLSDIHPEKTYNWMTSELIHWRMPDGKIGEGILYKPENFDPGKKYPLIFDYYMKSSNYLYTFRKPDLAIGRLSIPWYVSNGYLVFVPDIYYTPKHTGQSVVNSVVSAAKYLSTFPWVDAAKMGLQGHSFGGYETNYLITHSTLFAAAQESAGPSDFISLYGGTVAGESAAFLCETGQNGLQVTPWKRPDIYLENSPVFRADKVKTPLLIQHNKEDGIVPFAQALELFTALRRIQKPVWMLQYDGEGHILNDAACKLDFAIRQQQFFDHYLKGAPMPIWMLEGIPAKYKGIKSGLALSGQ